MKRSVATLGAFVTACGTLASPAENGRDLPNNRLGPFRELTSAELGDRQCVAVDFNGLLDEPSVLRLADGGLMLYASRVRDDRRTIARTRLRSLSQQSDDPIDVLTASLPWHAMSVSSPDVTTLPDGGYAMVFATGGGALGLARSDDGLAWRSLPTPILVRDGAAGEETDLGAPSIVVTSDNRVTLAYTSGSAIWLARAPNIEGPYTRIDTNPQTARRDPLLAPIDEASVQRDAAAPPPGFESGSVSDPELTYARTAVGRPIWRLYYTARTVPIAMDGGLGATSSIGVAASFDGLRFERVGAPAFAPHRAIAVRGPVVLDDGALRTMLYVGGRCELSREKRGIRAAIAPGNERVTPVQ